MKKSLFATLLVLIMVAFSGPGQTSPQVATATQSEPKTVYIRAGRLVDATSDNILQNMVIVVEGERIKGIGPAASIAIPAGGDAIDLSGATILPGLIDCHTHLG